MKGFAPLVFLLAHLLIYGGIAGPFRFFHQLRNLIVPLQQKKRYRLAREEILTAQKPANHPDVLLQPTTVSEQNRRSLTKADDLVSDLHQSPLLGSSGSDYRNTEPLPEKPDIDVKTNPLRLIHYIHHQHHRQARID